MMLDIKTINMMMKKMKIRKQLYIYIILDWILLCFSFYKGISWIINSQVAFFSSLIVVILSFLSYAKTINKQVNLLKESISDRDMIDEMDDPYELYDDEDKEKIKISKIKISMKNLAKSKSGVVSFFRILGYVVLIVGFIMLVRFHIFMILPYILGISVVPIGTMLSGLGNHR